MEGLWKREGAGVEAQTEEGLGRERGRLRKRGRRVEKESEEG